MPNSIAADSPPGIRSPTVAGDWRVSIKLLNQKCYFKNNANSHSFELPVFGIDPSRFRAPIGCALPVLHLCSAAADRRLIADGSSLTAHGS